MGENTVRVSHVADAYEQVAKANHYLIGITATDISDDELEAAKQMLINRQNTGPQQGKVYCRLELALDLIEQEIKTRVGGRRRAVPPLTIVSIDTPHFEFVAVGRDEAEARQALEKGWDAHVMRTGAQRDYLNPFEEGNVKVVHAGQCFRDGTVFTTL